MPAEESSERFEKETALEEPDNSSNKNLKTKGRIGNIFRRFLGAGRNQRKNQSFLDIVDSGFATVKDASLEAFKLPSAPLDLESKDLSKVHPSKGKAHDKGDSQVEKKDQKKSEEEDVHATFKYLSIMTALYLPFLLFLWIRRNVLGTGSLVRSLFFGHMLRYGVAFLLLPPSVTKTFVPESVWNFGVRCIHQLDKWWKDDKVQSNIPTWIHFVLKIVFGINTDKSTSSLGSQVSSTGVSPPLMALGIFTIMVFVVHPDGMTWIMLGQIRDSITSLVDRSTEWIYLVRSGKVKLTAAQISSTIATTIIIFTIISSVVSNWNKDTTKSKSASREKIKIKNSKKGKKGRGRNQHVMSKVKLQQTHENKTQEEEVSSESRSPSPLRNRCLSDMEATTISTGSDSNMHNVENITVPLPSIPQIEEEEKNIQNARVELCEERINKRETKNVKAQGEVDDPYDVSFKASAQNAIRDLSTCPIDVPDDQKNKKKLNKSKKAGTLSSNTKDPESITDSLKGSRRLTLNTPKYNSDNRKEKATRSVQRAPILKEKKIKSSFSSNETLLREKRQSINEFTTERNSIPQIPEEELKLNDIHVSSSSSLRYESKEFYVNQKEHFDLDNITSSEIAQDTSSHIRQRKLEPSSFEPSGYFHSAAKLELSSFLSKLGLHETALSMLSNVESLNQLTDHDYDRLGIDLVKRTIIRSALEVRSMYQSSQSNPNLEGFKTANIRAPPGICAPIEISHQIKEDMNTSQPSSLFSSSVAPSASQFSVSVGSSMNSFSGIHGYTENSEHSNDNAQFLNSISDHVILPPLSPLRQDSSPHIYGSEMHQPKIQGDEDVEAEMEVLGGQMAVSILDF